MPRSLYPPPGFECLYRHSCPYLDGLSTTWVLGEYRRGEEEYQEHLRILDHFYDSLKTRDERIRVLERENAALAAMDLPRAAALLTEKAAAMARLPAIGPAGTPLTAAAPPASRPVRRR
jgi:hypothetical protein